LPLFNFSPFVGTSNEKDIYIGTLISKGIISGEKKAIHIDLSKLNTTNQNSILLEESTEEIKFLNAIKSNPSMLADLLIENGEVEQIC